MVGYEEARVSRRIWPDADQRKTSIWPGVSTMMYLLRQMGVKKGMGGYSWSGARFSMRPRI
jgi:hypothetical protein